LTDELPIPRFFEQETGPYISAGAIVAKDRLTGKANLSIARLKPIGGNRALVGIAPNHHLAVLARAAHARGETLDIAVCIGNHPAVLIASCLYLGLGDDELKIAGALLGEPLDVARCIGMDLLVPAQCECVLEGKLDAGTLVEEGTVSEFHGTYLGYGTGIVASFDRLTRRHDAVFQVILPGYHPEHCLLGGVAIAAGLARAARASVPAVHEVAVGFGGAGRFHAVITLKDPRPGDARKAMFSVWAAVNLVKRIIVVDDDVDPWDAVQVEWAIATRSKADRDTLIVPGVRTDRSDPLATDGVIAKVGIDATKRSSDRPNWRIARPPDSAIAKARDLLKRTSTRP
jgi:4-hydroxy-3-polyprenylbenzoate decarboxylase